MINSRAKGASGEREAIKLLADFLGDETIKRNLQQTRDGGHDINGLTLDYWAIEIKRCKKPELLAWWKQACNQAAKAGKMPALLYRLDRQQWRAVIPLVELANITHDLSDYDFTITTSIEAFCSIVRESKEYQTNMVMVDKILSNAVEH